MNQRRSFRLRFRQVEQPRRAVPPAPVRGRERGAYLWAEDGSEDQGETTSELAGQTEQPDSLALDPEVEQALQIALHHPGLAAAIAKLRNRKRAPSAGEIARLAHRFRISFGAVNALLESSDDPSQIDLLDDLIFVEVRPAMYIIRVPRPLTQRRREALRRWVSEERRWVDITHWQRGRDKVRRAGTAPAELEALDWFERWIAGESIPDIARSLPTDALGRPFESDVKQAVRRLWLRMRELSPDDLPEHGP